MKKIIFLFLIFILFLPLFLPIVNAEINLSVRSENERLINIRSFNNFTNVSIFNDSQFVNLTYDNYILNIYPDYTKLKNSTIVSNMNKIFNDRFQFIWIGIIFMIIIFAYLVIKNL